MITAFDDAVDFALERGEEPTEYIRWRLSIPKYSISDDAERLQQMLASCYAVYLTHTGSQIKEDRPWAPSS